MSGRLVWSGVAVLAAVLAGCGSGEPDTSSLEVVATTVILGDVVDNLLQGNGSVTVLVPDGVDPHDFVPSSRQVAAINEADLVVANGLGLEEGLLDVLEAARSDGANVFEVAPLLEPRGLNGSDECDGTGDQSAEPCDPHVWLDPVRMATAAGLVADELAKVDPGIDWAARAETYGDELLDAHQEMSALLASVPPAQRKLVTNHDSLGYFAARYEFEVVGVIVPGGSTLGDPSSEALAQLVEVIVEEDVPAIFAETTSSSLLAETVAAEAGENVDVVELYTESFGSPGSGADTLIGMLLTDARLITDALT